MRPYQPYQRPRANRFEMIQSHLTRNRILLLLPAMKLALSAVLLSLLAGCSTHPARNPTAAQSAVQRHGRLQVKSGQLCDESGSPVQLRGMSSHDLKRFPFSENTVSNLASGWHASVVRAAMYTDSYGSSYIHEPQVKQAVQSIIEQALRNGIYVIVDWHILQDGNPNRYKEEAKLFFEDMARTYGSRPNIIYEICNEPNGPGVTWKEIKSFAEFVIPAIRAIDPHNIIIVGTDNWSQGVRAASESALDFPNVMYALHFYAGTHRDDLRRNADDALSRGLPIFVTEWGLTDASGKGALHMAEGQKWVDWMNAHKISWANWSFSNFDESTAALKPSATMDGPWADTDLSDSGAWVKSHMAESK